MARRYTEKHTLLRPLAMIVCLALLLISWAAPTKANVSETTSSKEHSVTLDMSSPEEAYPLSFLAGVARATLKKHFGLQSNELTLEQFAKSFPLTERYKKSAGLFVTFSTNGKTRACWGALDAHFTNLVQATVFTTEQALTDEYRYKKITASEIESLKPQVTVVKRIEPLHNIYEQNPRTCGMLVRSGGKAGVVLPGEYTDAYYQLVQCKLKAGIKKKEPCQIYRIRADVYR